MIEGTAFGGAGPVNTPLMTAPMGKYLVITDLDYSITWDNGMSGNRVQGPIGLWQGMTPRWSYNISGYTSSAGAESRDMLSKSFRTGIVFPQGQSASVIHWPWQNSQLMLQVRWQLSWSGYLAPSTTTGVNEPAEPKNELKLGNLTPNPLGDETHIGFSLSKDSRITLRVVDARGRVVRKLFDGRQPAGEHNLVWNARGDDGREVRSGVYFIELLTGNERLSRKAVVLD
jgi:hypothetical protein